MPDMNHPFELVLRDYCHLRRMDLFCFDDGLAGTLIPEYVLGSHRWWLRILRLFMPGCEPWQWCSRPRLFYQRISITSALNLWCHISVVGTTLSIMANVGSVKSDRTTINLVEPDSIEALYIWLDDQFNKTRTSATFNQTKLWCTALAQLIRKG